jgi:tetratricopeptide (TPR) repeat protein
LTVSLERRATIGRRRPKIAVEADALDQDSLNLQAIELYKEELGLCPFDYLSRLKMAYAMWQAGDVEDAQRQTKQGYLDMQERVGLFPWRTEYELMRTAPEQELAKAALESLKDSGQLKANGYAILQTAYAELGDLKGAEECFEKAISLDPDNFQAWQGLLDRQDSSDVPDQLLAQLPAKKVQLHLPSDRFGEMPVKGSCADMYNEAAAAKKTYVTVSRPIYDLRATRVFLGQNIDDQYLQSVSGRYEPSGKPGLTVLQDPVVSEIATLIDLIGAPPEP